METMHIVIPARMFPAVVLAAIFMFTGVGTGATAYTAAFHWHAVHIPHLILLPVFAVAILYLFQAWRGQTQVHDVASEISTVSSRLLAALFSVCLIVGLACGALIGYAAQPIS